MIQTTLIRPSELDAHTCARWARLQMTVPGLENPCFHPEFVRALGEARNDIEIAVIEEAGRTVGFFPFRRLRKRSGRPAGWRLSEFHGPVIDPDIEFCPLELLFACRLDDWEFDCLPSECGRLTPWSIAQQEVAYVALNDGGETYEEQILRRGSSLLSRTKKRIRMLEREVGPVRFVLHTDEQAVLAQLIEWKSQQHVRTGVLDVFQFDWFRTLMERFHGTHHQDFRGCLSALYAGDQLVAIHFGLHSRTVRHMWYSSYDQAFAKYSPGIMVRLALFRELPECGIQRADLGAGEFDYKERLKTASRVICQGCVTRSGIRQTIARSWIHGREWALKSCLRRPAQRVAQWIRPYRARRAFQ